MFHGNSDAAARRVRRERRWGVGGAMIAASALAISMMGPAASAVDSKDNAALKYWRALSLMTDEQSRALRGAVYSITEYGLEFDEGERVMEADELLDQMDLVIEMLVEGSQLTGCDFAVDWHKGIEALLPELSPMRNAARLLMLDASRELNSGDPEAAAERVATVLRMGEHVSQDPVLITSLVGLAMFRMAGDFAIAGERAGVWTEESRTTIAHALDRYHGEDPFRFIRSMRGEERWVGDWLEQRIDKEWSTPEGFLEDVRMFTEVVSIDPGPAGGGAKAPAADANRQSAMPEEPREIPDELRAIMESPDLREALKQEVELYRTAVRINTEAWNSPDALQRFERFERMLGEGEFGVLSQWMIPSFTRAHKQDHEARAFLEELRFAFRSR
ncbi:MAG: hypothetical protein ACTS3F_07355 [Phycisphaerales bacterium]